MDKRKSRTLRRHGEKSGKFPGSKLILTGLPPQILFLASGSYFMASGFPSGKSFLFYHRNTGISNKNCENLLISFLRNINSRSWFGDFPFHCRCKMINQQEGDCWFCIQGIAQNRFWQLKLVFGVGL